MEIHALEQLLTSPAWKMIVKELEAIIAEYDRLLTRDGMSEQEMLNGENNRIIYCRYDLYALIRHELKKIIQTPQTLIQKEKIKQQNNSTKHHL